jgi:hypothetical protein
MAIDIMIQRNDRWLTSNINGIQITFEGMTVKVRGFFIKDDVEHPINFDYTIPIPDDEGPDHYLFAITRSGEPVIGVNHADIGLPIWGAYAELSVEPGTTDLETQANGFIFRLEPMDEDIIDSSVHQAGNIREVY